MARVTICVPSAAAALRRGRQREASAPADTPSQELPMLADQPTSAAPRNRLLAPLPPDALAQLGPRLEPVELPLRKVLHAPGAPIDAVYFPETGWISMLA